MVSTVGMALPAFIGVGLFMVSSGGSVVVMLIMLLLLCIGVAIGHHYSMLKLVKLDESGVLIISNYLTEIRVPLNQIVAIRENIHHPEKQTRYRVNRPFTRYIRVEFAQPTAYGLWILFAPDHRGVYRDPPHPIAEELRYAVKNAGGTLKSGMEWG
ncbi:MAG: hypothetical protein ABIR47_12330 [Candidatus Kapaibacterium sp.]